MLSLQILMARNKVKLTLKQHLPEWLDPTRYCSTPSGITAIWLAFKRLNILLCLTRWMTSKLICKLPFKERLWHSDFLLWVWIGLKLRWKGKAELGQTGVWADLPPAYSLFFLTVFDQLKSMLKILLRVQCTTTSEQRLLSLSIHLPGAL